MSKSHAPSGKSLLDKVDLNKPLYAGYMYKQSHIPPKNFNKRYFVLFPKILVYYDTERDFGRDVASKTLAVSLSVNLLIIAPVKQMAL